MKLLTKKLRKDLPELYSQEDLQDDAKAIVKFFTPWANWTWYALEFDGEDRFFGYVVGDYPEYGYFSLKELESVNGPFGLKIERDKYFDKTTMREIKEMHNG